MKGQIARWLLQSTDWSLFLVVFGETHRGGHLLWPEPGYEPFAARRDAMLEVYQAVDEAIGHVLEGADEATTSVVFSLHGMETNRSQGHFVRPLMDRINATADGGATASDAPDARASRGGIVRMLRLAVPGRLQHAIARAAPIQLLDWVSNRDVTGGMDWRRTPGFALRPDLHGYVRFNLVGRESAGILQPGGEGHRSYLDRVRRAFLSVKTEVSKQQIVRDVLSIGDVFPGARTGMLPDVVVRWEKLRQATKVRSDSYGAFSAEPDTGRCGEHRSRGFAALSGPRRNESLPPLAHGKDFPAFVRALLGYVPAS